MNKNKNLKKIMNSFKKRKQAQLSIANLINWVILVIIGGVLTLVLSPLIVEFTASENSSLNKLVIYMIIPFFWLAILVTLMMYAQPQAPLRPY